MHIEQVEAIPYRIPFRKALKFASGEITHADHVLVRIQTSGGIVGYADAPPRPYTYGELKSRSWPSFGTSSLPR